MLLPSSTRSCLAWLRCALLAAGLWLAGAAAAMVDPTAPQVLGDSRPQQDAWPALRMFSDPGQAMTLAQVQAQQPRFAPPGGPASNLGIRRDAVWLHLPLVVDGGDGHWLLNIDYPPLNRVDVYLLAEGRLVQQWQLGTSQPFDQRPLPTRTHAAPLVLTPGTAYEVYLRVQTDSSMVLPISLIKPEPYHAHEAGVQLAQGMMAGVALALLFYSLVNCFGVGGTMFGLHALSVTGALLFFLSYFGLAQQHLWHEPTGWLTKLAPLSVLLTLTSAGRFVALTLNVQQSSRRLYLGINGTSILAGVALVLSLSGLLNYRSTQLAATLLGPVLLLLSVPAAWAQARQGSRVGRYMLIGWGAYLVGAVTIASLLRGWVPANFWTQHLFQVGWLMEMLVWLRVLSLHAESLRREAEQTEMQRQLLESLAYTDALTGLPNRRGLGVALQDALGRCRGDAALAVFLIDLDGFKLVNDRLGHDIGDAVLIEVGRRLKQHLRREDVVGRLGGDEFVIVAERMGNEAEAHALGGKLLAAFREPLLIDGHACPIGLTIGFALAPHDGASADDLLKRADAAMYAGKQAGRHTVRRGTASHGLAGALAN